MQIAILSDIHGNSLALDAVLSDIKARGGVDAYWILGDLCAIGSDPVGVLERVSQLPNTVIIKGNADRFVSTLDLPPPSLQAAQNDKSLIEVLMEVSGNFSWTRGALDATGWTSWLAGLPYDHTTQLSDGTQVLLVHSQPQTDEGRGLNPSISDDELAEALADVDARLVCVGHFHMPMYRCVDDKQVINPGSVSNSFYGDMRAHYAMLHVSETGHDIRFHAVSYDIEAAFEHIRQTNNIGNGYNIRILSGDVNPSWLKAWDGTSHFPTIEPELT